MRASRICSKFGYKTANTRIERYRLIGFFSILAVYLFSIYLFNNENVSSNVIRISMH